MKIPSIIILLIFIIFIGLIITLTFVNTFHMLKFGEKSKKTKTMTIIYLSGISLLLTWSLFLILSTDWSQSINILESRNTLLLP